MKYDIVVVGSCTAGIYFAKRMADRGYKVLVTDKDKKADCGKRLDIFHMDLGELKKYGAPVPEKDDKDFVRSFNFSASRSALGRWEKYHEHTVYVMHLPLYVQRLIKWASDAGVDFKFEHCFKSLTYGENGKINGALFTNKNKTVNVEARLVADCSGAAAAVRRTLPEGYGVENFTLTEYDKFYVTIKYIKFKMPKRVNIRHTISWPYYKVWIGPCEDEDGAILGVGANMSFDYGERNLEKFLETIKIPDYDIIKTERGTTPYRRPPYSFVADGFVALGDSACITKPNNGEGITAAWYLVDIAAEEIANAMSNGAYPTAENMWQVNKRYQSTQGAEFAETLATVTGAVNCTPEENDYEFKNNIIFKNSLKNNKQDKSTEKRELIEGLVLGAASKELSAKTLNNLIKYASVAAKIKAHYLNYPETPETYTAWKETADELWKAAGSMSDVIYDKDYYLNDL